MSDGPEQLVLVLGDLHIPHRKDELPAPFKSLLTPGRFHHVLCTGNTTNRHTTDWVRSLAPTAHFARGDLDTEFNEADFPDQKTVRIGGVTIHLIHGHQVVPWGDPAALLGLSRSLDADLLIHGHTHTTQVWYDKNTQRMMLNPGSTTGAYSPFNTNVVPSFLVLSIRGKSCTVYCYEARGGEVRVTKADYTSPR